MARAFTLLGRVRRLGFVARDLAARRPYLVVPAAGIVVAVVAIAFAQLTDHGVDQVLFASDTPFEPEPGMYIGETIDVIDRLEITDDERDRIYWKNAQRLLRLDVRD